MNINPVSAQVTFETVVSHLRKQGMKAVTERTRDNDQTEEVCLYRTSEGLKCAVGCLIDDSEYQESLEGTKVTFLMGSCPIFKDEYGAHIDLINDLQNLHDYDLTDANFAQNLEIHLPFVAKKYGLTIPPIEVK